MKGEEIKFRRVEVGEGRKERKWNYGGKGEMYVCQLLQGREKSV